LLGELDGRRSLRLEELERVFRRAGLRPVPTFNVNGVLWTKLLVNVGINALTALARVKNGQLLEIPELEVLMERAVAEAKAVARAKDIKLTTDDPLAYVKGIARATRGNISSMRQDVENGRPTEIEVINGTVIREGAALGIPTPVNEILSLLVRGREKSYYFEEDSPGASDY